MAAPPAGPGHDRVGRRQRPLDDEAYALDHIVTKLDMLPGKMRMPVDRALADQRLAVLTDFRAAFADEWGSAA